MVDLSAQSPRNRDLAICRDERMGKTAEDLFTDPVEGAGWQSARVLTQRTPDGSGRMRIRTHYILAFRIFLL